MIIITGKCRTCGKVVHMRSKNLLEYEWHIKEYPVLLDRCNAILTSYFFHECGMEKALIGVCDIQTIEDEEQRKNESGYCAPTRSWEDDGK